MNSQLSLKITMVIALLCLLIGAGLGGWYGFKRGSTYEAPSTVYAVLGEHKVTSGEVVPLIQDDLVQLEKNIYALKKTTALQILEKKSPGNVSTRPEENEDPFKRSFTAEELKSFADERKINLTKLSESARRDLVRNFQLQKAAESRARQTQSVSAAVVWKIPMKFLTAPVKVGSSKLESISPKGADQRLDVFFNYHCSLCKIADENVRALVGKFKDDLEIRFHLSLREPVTSIAYQTALAAICANIQKKFLPFHKAAFENPPRESSDLIALATKATLDVAKFEECLKSESSHSILQDELKLAQELVLPPGAYFFVNGRPTQANEPLTFLEDIINQ